MLFRNIKLLDENLKIRDAMYVGIRGSRIEYIGQSDNGEDYGEVYDGSGKLLMSGLYNTHSHAAMTLLRGYAENLPLQSWLSEKVFPFEAKLCDRDVYCGTILAVAEMLRHGIVSFTDMYMHGEGIARAVGESGIKANISLSTVCFDERDYSALPVFKENERIFKQYNNAFEGRLKVDYCIHAEYTSTKRVVRSLAEKARENNANIHLHLSETLTEHEDCLLRHGMTPAQYFESLSVFESPVTAAHCVYVSDEDMEILKRNNVSAAINPASNMKLASGFARVPVMLRKGLNLTLGTDGAASNNALNLWRDLYLFSTIYKASSNKAEAVRPEEALKCVTANGAYSQLRENCGALKAGNKADLIVIDLDRPNLCPPTNILNNLCYSMNGSEVLLTMVEGKVLYKNGEYSTLDIEKIMFEARKCTEKIISEI